MSSNCPYKKKGFIETRGEHNHETSAGNSDARNVIKHLKDISERFTPTVAVASAVLPVTYGLATQFSLLSKEKLIQTAARTRKQLVVNMLPIPVALNFEIPEIFEAFIWYDSGSNDHELIFFAVAAIRKAKSSGEVIFLISRWTF